MGYLDERPLKAGGSSWRFVYYYGGHKKTVKIGKTVKRTAKKRAAQFENMLSMGLDPAEEVVGADNPEFTLKKLKDVDREWCENRRQPRTVEMNNEALDNLIAWKGNLSLNHFNNKMCSGFLEYLSKKRKWSNTTINMTLRTLRAVFQRGVDEHRLIRSNPWKGIKQFKVERSADHIEFLTVDQVNVLLKEVEKKGDLHFYRLIQFYLFTGCRRNEALEINPAQDIRLNEGVIFLGQPKSQTKVRRGFPVSDDLKELLDQCDLRRERLFSFTSDQVNNRLSKLGKNVKELPDRLYPHMLRHSFASHLVMAGVDMRTVAELMGHTTTKVTELYSHLIEEHKRKTLSKLPW